MKNLSLCLTLFSLLSITYGNAQEKEKTIPSIQEKVEGMQRFEGYMDFFWDEKQGKIWMLIDQWNTEFLYINSLPAGVGSNDIGLDRGQLGGNRIVKFQRIGPKVLMIEPNYSYRAESDNQEEQLSVEQAFAQSVLFGFKVGAQDGNRALVDATDFLLRDAHGIINRLGDKKQGKYKLDSSRSAIYLPMCKNFPNNTEFEAIITYVGDPKGSYIKSVTPTPEAITVRQHHSFVQLPDDNYKPRIFDPRSGYFSLMFHDYATPIQKPLKKRYIRRHRLEKKDPSAQMSEPVEPIVYYVDRGAPEPVKSALIEGAKWWNEAFEATGYKDAFLVKEMPDDADPMDIRYNLIQWVHRSTRGWSYGASVYDPRTGEIIKGHVSLGSLRVRQDFLIAQGLFSAYENGKEPDPKLLEMALARLRQLSAHEVGHTLGLAHNFAASVNDRASVMDYPHPFVFLNKNGTLDFSEAYDTGIGEWDKRSILYGYQDFPEEVDNEVALNQIVQENIDKGFIYISDQDARPKGGAHPSAHLWDNGVIPAMELRRINQLRFKALSTFSEKNIPEGAPMATLEHVLVPLYLSHRYQVEAVVKLIGGINYSYASRGDGQVINEPLPNEDQQIAINELLVTLSPEFLFIPENIVDLIPPQPIGYSRGRELFKNHTGVTFDPLGAAEASANHTLELMMYPERLARIIEQYARGNIDFSLSDYLTLIYSSSSSPDGRTPKRMEQLHFIVQKLVVHHLLNLAGDRKIMQQVSATALDLLNEIANNSYPYSNTAADAHKAYIDHQIEQFKQNPSNYKVPEFPKLPDGSPIGCGEEELGIRN